MNDFTDFSGSKKKKLFIQHFSNKQQQRERLKLEVLAWLMVLGSCKNVPLCKHTVTDLLLYWRRDLRPHFL